MAGPHVVLLGLMGAGKTSVGRELARRLECEFSDSDQWIRARTRRLARELKHEQGAERLHAMEAEHLLGALASSRLAVIAAAASVVERSDCRVGLRQPSVYTVWLDVQPSVLAERFASDAHRPRYGDDTLDFLSAQQHVREPAFREIADLIVQATDCTTSEIADAIIVARATSALC